MVVEDQKSTVTSHRVGQEVKFNQKSIDPAGHYGFLPQVCRLLDRLALKWLEEEALDGTVKDVVRDRFERGGPYLGPPPCLVMIPHRWSGAMYTGTDTLM
nr:hypothetical protein [Desulfobacterales bacterium]